MEQTFGDIMKSYLVGKKVKHKNRYGREVTLEVEDVTTEHRSREITPGTKENDWYGESENWTETYLCFIDGSKVQIYESTKIDIIEETNTKPGLLVEKKS